MEPQTGLQDLQIDEAELKKQTKEAASFKGKRAFAAPGLSQYNVEYGLYA